MKGRGEEGRDGEKARTGGHAANEPDADPARDPAQQAAPRAWNLTDLLQVVEEGDSLPWPLR